MRLMEKKKLIGATAFALALAGGGVAGAVLGSPLTSGAQESTTTTADPGPDSTAPPGGGFRHGGFGHLEHPKLDAAAKVIGITTEELLTELRAGKTIAQVA